MPSDTERKLREELDGLKKEHDALTAAAGKMVRALHAGAFIIPNGGARRDRAIASWDGLLEALGLKAGDLDAFSTEDPAGVEVESDGSAE